MSKKIRPGILIGGVSDVGKTRETNEDSFGYFEPPDDKTFEERGRLLLVCDGMGGAAAGDKASRIALEKISEEYFKATGLSEKEALVLAFHKANKKLYDLQQKDRSLKGMGTTCIAVVIKGNKATFVHVGDSRGYLIRNKKIFQITEDHSRVQEMVRRGWISKEEAEDHPDKHILDRVLGHSQKLNVDATKPDVPLDENYSIVLCSDGLTSYLKKEEIADVVSDNLPAKAAEMLVSMANDRGGNDNITVLIATIKKDAKQEIPLVKANIKEKVKTWIKKPFLRIAAAIFILIIILLILILKFDLTS